MADKDGESQDKKRQLQDIVNAAGRLTVSDAGDKMGLENFQVSQLAEQLKAEGKLTIELHYLREPELESTDFQKKREELGKVAAKKVPSHTPEIPQPDRHHGLKEKLKQKELEVEKYALNIEDIHFDVRIIDTGDFVPHYLISLPHIDFVTR